MGEDEPSDYIKLEKFSAVALGVMKSGKMARSDPDILLQAFKKLDTEGKGYLLPEQLARYMTTMGESMSPEEIEEMLTVIPP